MASKTEAEIFVDLPVILEWKRTTDSDGVWRPHCVEGRVGSELDMHETRDERRDGREPVQYSLACVAEGTRRESTLGLGWWELATCCAAASYFF